MARPLFEIALEIAADWKNPTPAAKTYLKGMYSLLGMDDIVADLNASTTVRMFLLYCKEWVGPVADRVKAELTAMRSSTFPKNADLLNGDRFPVVDVSISSCELCDAPFGNPQKYVESFTHWGAKARMCMHCNLCLSPGVDRGDGAIYICDSAGRWRHVHGKANGDVFKSLLPAPAAPFKNKNIYQLPLRHRLKRFGRKVVKKCSSIVHGWFRKSA